MYLLSNRTEKQKVKTKTSTDDWKGIFKKLAKARGKEEKLESNDIPEVNNALSQFYTELRKENGQAAILRARVSKGDAGGFRSTFKEPKLSKVYPEGYRVPVFEESVGGEGEKAARTRHGKTTQQSKKPDDGR